MKKINEEKKNIIKEMLELRYDYNTIAEKIGVCVGTVAKYKKLLNKEYGIEASNRWSGGIIASEIIPKNFEEEKEIKKNDDHKFITDVEKTIQVKGALTSFLYTYSTKNKVIRIDSYNPDPMEVTVNDLLGFANELFDIATELEKMK